MLLFQPIGGRQMRLDEMWRGGQQNVGGQAQARPAQQHAAVNPSPVMVQVCIILFDIMRVMSIDSGSHRHGFPPTESGASVGQMQQ